MEPENNSSKQFIIDRSLWLFGKGGSCSNLYRAELGKYCCLGLLGLQLCGLSKEELDGIASPVRATVFDKYDAVCPWLFEEGGIILKASEEAMDLMVWNDDMSMDNETREKKITEIFAKHNIEVKFQ